MLTATTPRSSDDAGQRQSSLLDPNTFDPNGFFIFMKWEIIIFINSWTYFWPNAMVVCVSHGSSKPLPDPLFWSTLHWAPLTRYITLTLTPHHCGSNSRCQRTLTGEARTCILLDPGTWLTTLFIPRGKEVIHLHATCTSPPIRPAKHTHGRDDIIYALLS